MRDAIQRQVIEVFGRDDPGQQAHCRHTAVDHCGWYGFRRDGFATPAGILWADVAVHEEFGGFDVQLFGDIFTDFYQIAAALFALAGLRFMAVFDAWQVIR